MDLTIYSPNPCPFGSLLSLSVKNLSNTFGIFSGGIPFPLSEILIIANPSSLSIDKIIFPSNGVKVKAL